MTPNRKGHMASYIGRRKFLATLGGAALNASTDREIDAAFATIVEERIGGLLVQAEPFLTSRRDQLVLWTTRHVVPTIFPWREFTTAGGLMSYGTSFTSAFRQVGLYAGQILQGAKPTDLPV